MKRQFSISTLLFIFLISVFFNTTTFAFVNSKTKLSHSAKHTTGFEKRANTFDFLVSVYTYNPKIQNYELSCASIKITADSYTVSDSLKATTNTVTVKDSCKRYIIEISKSTYETYQAEFTAQGLRAFISNPLMVILNKKEGQLIKTDTVIVKTEIQINKKDTVAVKKTINNEKKDTTAAKTKTVVKKPEPGLVAWYPFNGSAVDSSGNNHNGEDYGASGYIEGIMSEARYFSNNQNNDAIATDYTIIPNIISPEEFTINFWAKFDYSGNQQSIIYLSPGQDWTKANFWLALSNDMKLFAVVNGLDLRSIDYSSNAFQSGQFSNAYTNSKPLELNKYYNISYVFKKSVATILIDGKPYAKYQNIYKNIGKPEAMVLIGACPQPGGLSFPYTGQIDELRFYKKALDAPKIMLLIGKK